MLLGWLFCFLFFWSALPEIEIFQTSCALFMISRRVERLTGTHLFWEHLRRLMFYITWLMVWQAMIPISNHSNSIVKEEYFVTKDNACFDMTPHSASSRSMIVRVCRDREYCDRNACIRKCCAEDELFYARECRKRNMTKGSAEFHPVFASAVNATQSSTFDTTKGCSNEIYVWQSSAEETYLLIWGCNYVVIYCYVRQHNRISRKRWKCRGYCLTVERISMSVTWVNDLEGRFHLVWQTLFVLFIFIWISFLLRNPFTRDRTMH